MDTHNAGATVDSADNESMQREKPEDHRHPVKSDDGCKRDKKEPEEPASAGSQTGGGDVSRFNTSLKEAEEVYYYFWKEKNAFSQWHPSTFTLDDKVFCCAEQYMMYTKAVLQHDDDMAKKIMHCDDPRKIKALGRKATNYSPDLWYHNCLHVVKDGNRAKFQQNKKLKEILLNSYPKILVEASPYDKRWGIGLEKHEESAWNEVTWEGLNLLGFILTELRDEFLFENGFIKSNEKKIYFDKLTQILKESLENDKGESEYSRNKNHGKDRHQYNHHGYRGDQRGDPASRFDKHKGRDAVPTSDLPILGDAAPDNEWMKDICIAGDSASADVGWTETEGNMKNHENTGAAMAPDDVATYIEGNDEEQRIDQREENTADESNLEPNVKDLKLV